MPATEDETARPLTAFRGRSLPVPAALAGYARLVERYDLRLPLPPQLTAIAGHHRPREFAGWLVLPERYAPVDDLAGQLGFAIKWEGVDFAVLDALFRVVPAKEVAAAVRTAPTGAYMRRLWFLYEWLTGTRLRLPDLGKVKAVDAINGTQQVALDDGPISARHRVRDNVPGTPAFCPMVWLSPAIIRHQDADLAERLRQLVERTPADTLERAAAFLLVGDAHASHALAGEDAAPDRTRRWARAIARAGEDPLSLASLEALQQEVVGDLRFVRDGLREGDAWVGDRDPATRAPIPVHLGSKAIDLPSIVEGIVAYAEKAGRGDADPVAVAAVAAFGLAYAHPFEDGNGRVHRWLVHHVLAASGWIPSGVTLPVSAAMLRDRERYRRALAAHSRPLLDVVEWRTTEDGEVEVRNETAPWYRFHDATAQAEFTYSCVDAAIRHDLPRAIAHVEAYDRFAADVQAVVDMPARTLALLHRRLHEGDGRLEERGVEFAALTDDEVARIEQSFAEAQDR